MCGRCMKEGDTEEAWMKAFECAPVKKRRKPKAKVTNEQSVTPVLPAVIESPKKQWRVNNLIILKLAGSVSYLELMRCESSRLHFRSCNYTTEDYANEVRTFLYSECIFTPTDSEVLLNENRQKVLSLHLLTDQRSQVEELSTVIESLESSISGQLPLIQFGTAYILPSKTESVQKDRSLFSVIQNAWHHLSSSLFPSMPSKSETYPGQEDLQRFMIKNELAVCNAKLLVLRPADIPLNERRNISVTEVISMIKRIFSTQQDDAGLRQPPQQSL